MLSRRGDSELTREMLQLGHERLRVGGRMLASIDHVGDHWLLAQLQKLFEKVRRRQGEGGVIYEATKTGPLKKRKNYAAEFAFRDGERLIQLHTRPGIFSHRELDDGARALIKTMAIEPGMRVLDIGCGSGAVAIAAALRASGVRVTAIDSHPRAIECTRFAAEQNNAAQGDVRLDCDGSTIEPGEYDVVAMNPPYYSGYQLARLFVAIAERATRPGSRLFVVTKTPRWYGENLPEAFGEVVAQRVGHYTVMIAQRTA
jgi:16S rRNA (guanine1207-N2)-methyltransferase